MCENMMTLYNPPTQYDDLIQSTLLPPIHLDERPMKKLGLIAGVRKDADADEYPIVDNLVADSFAHSFMEHGGY